MTDLPESGAQPPYQPHRLMGRTWRHNAAKEICRFLTCGPNAYRDIGIDPVKAIEEMLFHLHHCAHDPIDEKNVLRCEQEPL